MDSKRAIICIDLKSFFASCECVERNLDPFSYPLVVASPDQKGAITLAVTPYLKSLGVKSRSRIYEIPKNIKYFTARPRMSLYIKKSKEVVDIYLDYVAKEDLHIYSIDECFLDVTHYLKLYKKDAYTLAKDIMDTVHQKTGLTATAGIGPNMLLAKVSMDIEAKHNPDNIAYWTYDDVKTKLWKITPLSDMWGIGKRMQNNLNKMHIYSVGDLAKTNVGTLKDKFGIIGVELWQHANGIDNAIISDFNMEAKSKSYSMGQVLYKDYNDNNIRLIIREMIESLSLKLINNHKQCMVIGLGIGYSQNVGGGFYHSVKLDSPTDLDSEIIKICNMIFDKYYEDMPIRKVTICFGNIINKTGQQLNLFQNEVNIKNEEEIKKTISKIQNKYGKNSIIKASSLLEDSTQLARNGKIGGHSA